MIFLSLTQYFLRVQIWAEAFQYIYTHKQFKIKKETINPTRQSEVIYISELEDDNKLPNIVRAKYAYLDNYMHVNKLNKQIS